MRGFHVRSVVKAADERIGGNVDRALDVAVAAQRKIREPAIAGRHAKLQGHAGSSHREIESVFELDFLRLRQSKLARDIGDRLLRKHDRARPHGANPAGKLNVFDSFGKALQSTTILFEKTKARAINLAVDEQTNETFVTEHRREGKLALRAVKRGGSFAERLAVNARYVLVRRVAHGRVIAIEIQRAHRAKMISRPRFRGGRVPGSMPRQCPELRMRGQYRER